MSESNRHLAFHVPGSQNEELRCRFDELVDSPRWASTVIAIPLTVSLLSIFPVLEGIFSSTPKDQQDSSITYAILTILVCGLAALSSVPFLRKEMQARNVFRQALMRSTESDLLHLAKFATDRATQVFWTEIYRASRLRHDPSRKLYFARQFSDYLHLGLSRAHDFCSVLNKFHQNRTGISVRRVVRITAIAMFMFQIGAIIYKTSFELGSIVILLALAFPAFYYWYRNSQVKTFELNSYSNTEIADLFLFTRAPSLLSGLKKRKKSGDQEAAMYLRLAKKNLLRIARTEELLKLKSPDWKKAVSPAQTPDQSVT